MQNYKELKVWVKAHSFTVTIYGISRLFPKEELYCLTNQLRQAARQFPLILQRVVGEILKMNSLIL